jgi:hypothetical protein
LTRIDRAGLGERQRRAKWYFKRWYRCDDPSCATKLVMIVEEGAIGWNVKPWPLERIREWQRRNKAARHPPPRSRDIALETLDQMNAERAADPSDSSPPW